MSKPILISGMQPSGKLHIGNYLGALKNFVVLQNSGKYQCYFFIADYHALTEPFDPSQTPALMSNYLAAGLDPKKSVLFVQSEVPYSTELAWILNTITPFSELIRMTQFKEKAMFNAKSLSGKIAEEYMPVDGDIENSEVIERQNKSVLSPNVGLFTYPTLMASDIILYNAEFVPVGNDQDQHLELTRELVKKFNNKFGKVFIEPKPVHTSTPRIMSLNDPAKKMSKSSPEGCLFLDDNLETIKKKISRAVTDSESEVKLDEDNKPGIANLIRIYHGITNKPIEKIESEFSGKNYGQLKEALTNVIAKELEPFRNKNSALSKKSKLAFSAGAKKARKNAELKMKLIKKAIGLIK